MSLNSSRRSHHRTNEMRAPAATLSSFKVSIARRCTAFTGFENIGVHPETHRASGLAPFKTSFVENAIETFALRGLLHVLRTRHNHRTHRRVDTVTFHDARRR